MLCGTPTDVAWRDGRAVAEAGGLGNSWGNFQVPADCHVDAQSDVGNPSEKATEWPLTDL